MMPKKENKGAVFFYSEFCAFEDVMTNESLGKVFRAVMNSRMGAEPAPGDLTPLELAAYNIFANSAEAALTGKRTVRRASAQPAAEQCEQSDLEPQQEPEPEPDDTPQEFCYANDSDENFAMQMIPTKILLCKRCTNTTLSPIQ